MASRSEVFSSRWGMLLVMLGMAVGTGNIWRFPRIAASNGGGSFLVAWVIFLLLWSVPLLLLEFGMGKGTRQGPVGAFVKTMGPKFAWMGAWVAWVAVAIMFYYSVVMGWTIRYFVASVTGAVPSAVPAAFWEGFHSTPTAVLTHVVAMCLGLFVVSRGVKGIETAARILIPSLIVLVVVLAIKAVTLPGASRGLAFLFTPDLAQLGNYRIWLEALTQNAWDTGAGWGLITAYAVYMRANDDTALNAFVIGFGNNSMSLLAGVMVLCTVFSIMPEAASEIVGAGNEGLTFIWVPQLFGEIPGGRFFMSLFFLALVFAAWTSLVAMIELASRILMDLGVERGRAIGIVGVAGLLFGAPSALNLSIFQNQDWVWGVGLMLSGFFFAVAVLTYGVTEWRERFLNTGHSDIHIGAWWDWAMRLVAVEAVVLMVWWLFQAQGETARETWTLFSPFNIGTVVIQWGVALGVFIATSRWMASRLTDQTGRFSDTPPPLREAAVKFARFQEVAEEAFGAIPEQYREGIDGLVVSRKTERHPTLPDIYTLGHCDTEAYLSDWQSPETTRSVVVLYWGSFQELSRLDPDFDWEAEIFETVEHEVRHHLEWLAGEDQLEDVDYAMDESFKRGEGLEWDPWYYQRGEHASPGMYVVEDQVYLEVAVTAKAFEEMTVVSFRWRGRSWEIDRPEELGDVHYVWVAEGVDRPPPWLEVVLVRSRSWWEDARRMLGTSRLQVLESDAVAREGGGGA